jgi:hypothetical protein
MLDMLLYQIDGKRQREDIAICNMSKKNLKCLKEEFLEL